MNTPWSITTTLRNPYRQREFLRVLSAMEGQIWESSTQIEYQLRLIQNRLYGFGSTQFYQGLSQELVKKIDDSNHELTRAEIEEIFDSKCYVDPPMRGRQSFNVLKKFGFVCLNNQRIDITESGHGFLEENYDLRETFLRILLKWQIPSPYYNRRPFNSENYNIKPFVGSLHLIKLVNSLEESLGNKQKGLSKDEFGIFVHTLINYQDIEKIGQTIIDFREARSGKSRTEQQELWNSQKKQYVANFLRTNDQQMINKTEKNLKEYGDNTIRYFRLTGFIHIRGDGFYVDLEPRRAIEIEELLESDNSSGQQFKNRETFINYISDSSQPLLPWETDATQLQILNQIQVEIHNLETKLNLTPTEIINPKFFKKQDRQEQIAHFELKRRDLFDIERYSSSQSTDAVQETIKILENIRQYEHRSILLEETTTRCLCALNDSIGINPQYPVGDDNRPTFTAPANVPDIECFYESFNVICEVTMLTDRKQWYYEGQPVMRHLRDFENKYPEKPAYCLFVAPSLHRDTINTFWASLKIGYEGQIQRIVPLTLAQLSDVMKTLLKLKQLKETVLKHTSLRLLFDKIIDLSSSLNDSSVWIEEIPETVISWEKVVLS